MLTGEGQIDFADRGVLALCSKAQAVYHAANLHARVVSGRSFGRDHDGDWRGCGIGDGLALAQAGCATIGLDTTDALTGAAYQTLEGAGSAA